MQVDFSQVLQGVNGPVMGPGGQGTATLKLVTVDALGAVVEEERRLPAEEKYWRFAMAKKIQSATEPLELSREEVEKLKEIVGRIYPPMVMGPAFDAFDGRDAMARTQEIPRPGA